MASEIQPLHQKTLDSNAILKKKLFEKTGRPNASFASPTDKMMSPTTQKLKNHKSRFLTKKIGSKLNLSSKSKLSSVQGKSEDDILKKKPAAKNEKEIDDDNDDEIMKNIDLNDI